MGSTEHVRQKYSRQIEFLFLVVGNGVGFGNVWRFPYVCYRNGGGVFLVPYTIACFLLGIPAAVLEGVVGQFTSRGVISAWKLVPLFQGVGVMLAVASTFIACYYAILFAWVLYYLFASMSAVLPWSHCDNVWNTPQCKVLSAPSNFSHGNLTSTDLHLGHVNPSTEFWERKVLSLSPGIDELGSVKWDLALCLLLSWALIYLCVWRGVGLTGKISYFTATAPYVLLLILLVRGLTLPGSVEGIKFYLLPDVTKLGNSQVWLDACIQVFYSYGVGMATHTALGSCNLFHHNILRDYLLFAGINSLTSLLSGFVIFSVLGFMAEQRAVPISKVAASGPGLAFIVYPEAIAQMPVPQLWAILFFLMLGFLAIDTEFAGADAILISLMDLIPGRYRKTPYKEVLAAVLCAFWFLAGLSMVTEGGVYLEQIFEWYCGGKVLFVLVFFECIVISCFYGASRFQRNLEFMLGYHIGPVFKYLWLVVTPAICLILLITDMVTYPDLTYTRASGLYRFPKWTKILGWFMCMTSILSIPVVLVWRLLGATGTISQRVRYLLNPQFTEEQKIRDAGVCEENECIPEVVETEGP